MSALGDVVAPGNGPGWLLAKARFNQWVFFDVGGGVRPIKLAWVIDILKGGTFPVVGLMMWYYSSRTPAATSAAAWTYLVMHGCYGLAWLIKDAVFPDPKWQQRATLPSCLLVTIGLGLYWSVGWLLISGTAKQHYPLPNMLWFTICSTMTFVGTAVMLISDAQKYYSLKCHRALITTGMFRYIRHPNYLGVMMVLASLVLMAPHWWSTVFLIYFFSCLFAVSLAGKEARLARYPEWADYKKRTWALIPGLI